MTDRSVASNRAPLNFTRGPLPAEDRFVCLPGCGLCCSYRVLVTEADRRRLETAAPLAAPQGPLEKGSDDRLALRRSPDFCLFLDSRQRCTVYEHRPEQCRTYPYFWVFHTKLEWDVDLSCPGLGRGRPMPRALLRPPEEAWLIRRRSLLEEVEGSLRAWSRFATQEALSTLGKHALDALTAAWSVTSPPGAATLRVSRALFPQINLETAEVVDGLWERLSHTVESVVRLIADSAFLERHFALPRYSTRLDGDGVQLYRFRLVKGAFHFEERNGKKRDVPLESIGQVPWQPQSLAVRRAYVERWLRRQLLVRLATHLAVADFVRGSHMATCYLQFLTEVDGRLAVLAPALALARGKETVDLALALEAVRGSDGLLRTWCQSARVDVLDTIYTAEESIYA